MYNTYLEELKTLQNEEQNRAMALAMYLEVKPEQDQSLDDFLSQFSSTEDDPNTFLYQDGEHLILKDDEADERAAEEIKESAWAFTTDFIFAHASKLPDDLHTRNAIQKLQEDLCESANPITLALIDDIDTFVEDAIAADGRGHFLNQWNGAENDINVNGTTYYLYRTN